MIDGARNALVGYLYQLLGTASIKVREVASGDDGWADLTAQIGDGAVRCEEFGQDATLRPLGLPNQGVVAIQFKYSATARNVIERRELINILLDLDRSRREATTDGVIINRYVLITNQSLDANAEELVNAGKKSLEPPRALRLRPTTNAGVPVAETASRLSAYGGDVDAAAKACHAVLQALDPLTNVTFEEDLHRLRQFAARYGVLDCEWEGRVNSLVGALVRETVGRRVVEITREWLKRHLVGDPQAANLHFGSKHHPHISTLCRTHLDKRVRAQHRIPSGCYVLRGMEESIRDQIASHPVVFVYGDGGCGKSLAVAEYLRSVCERQLVWSELATSATEPAIVQGINRVRLPGSPGGGSDHSLFDLRARLNVANRDGRPMWTIDLDGVDEAPGNRAEIRHLINECWAEGNVERSPASLLVTCRSPAAGDRAKGQLVSDWIGTPEPDLVQGVGFVYVPEFIDQHLAQAAILLNGLPEQRIINSLDPNFGSWSRQLPDTETISDEIIQALRHPVVWGGYASLSEAGREGVLAGDPTSLATLAEQLLTRFLLRCHARRMWSDELMVEKGLTAAARSITVAPPYSIEDWEQGCEPFLGAAEARSLYSEALSYGLVRRDAVANWRWGHRFVVDYMATRSNARS